MTYHQFHLFSDYIVCKFVFGFMELSNAIKIYSFLKGKNYFKTFK
jgi:hypothetical protein